MRFVALFPAIVFLGLGRIGNRHLCVGGVRAVVVVDLQILALVGWISFYVDGDLLGQLFGRIPSSLVRRWLWSANLALLGGFVASARRLPDEPGR